MRFVFMTMTPGFLLADANILFVTVMPPRWEIFTPRHIRSPLGYSLLIWRFNCRHINSPIFITLSVTTDISKEIHYDLGEAHTARKPIDIHFRI
jgi:hypothetical protein